MSPADSNGEVREGMRLAATIAGVSAAALLAGACALTPTAVDTRSPVAARIASGEDIGRWPTFADIPATPRDVRNVAGYDVAVGEVRAGGGELDGWAVSNPAMNVDTESFAAAARQEVAAAGAAVGENQTARTEAFAEEARRRAAPPPPPS